MAEVKVVNVAKDVIPGERHGISDVSEAYAECLDVVLDEPLWTVAAYLRQLEQSADEDLSTCGRVGLELIENAREKYSAIRGAFESAMGRTNVVRCTKSTINSPWAPGDIVQIEIVEK